MIRVLLFAELEERLGTRELELREGKTSVGSLRLKLAQTHSELEGIEHAMAAVNEEYAEDTTSVRDGDTVAFIPPVSGG
ncbi:molybdopterin converting factor subunit 1 [Alteribacter lacisalsi]|uniref:Molybdopterin synthase sulfur carrier subunit n=1 Tax=Alteribacter lacisalsi TaxID=2045244 RepID=A0A2W0H8E9_9BACI|nr:molybdopterin converting factor subunit 1 [Alteribacter lacisalsi]PYZ97437.1 molybdopterin converting factor subunit 1 [Alteribacter lacisalsi]